MKSKLIYVALSSSLLLGCLTVCNAKQEDAVAEEEIVVEEGNIDTTGSPWNYTSILENIPEEQPCKFRLI